MERTDGHAAGGTMTIDCEAFGLARPGSAGTTPVAVVLGSGFAGFASHVDVARRVPYTSIPGCPRVSAVPGHAGELVTGTIDGVPVVLLCGRFHLYQGVTAREAAFTARIAAGLGCRSIIVTNAAGAVSEKVRVGQPALITDHVNLTAANPLTGWAGEGDALPFVPMRDAYDPELRRLAADVAATQDLELAEGVYAAVPGPSFETSAEVAALRVLGVDMVGMSTVPEVIVARAFGMRVLGVSLITNVAAGVDLSHEEVLGTGAAGADASARLLIGILRAM